MAMGVQVGYLGLQALGHACLWALMQEGRPAGRLGLRAARSWRTCQTACNTTRVNSATT
jgi:hypothetical protein